jgi:hypothetical protein
MMCLAQGEFTTANHAVGQQRRWKLRSNGRRTLTLTTTWPLTLTGTLRAAAADFLVPSRRRRWESFLHTVFVIITIIIIVFSAISIGFGGPCVSRKLILQNQSAPAVVCHECHDGMSGNAEGHDDGHSNRCPRYGGSAGSTASRMMLMLMPMLMLMLMMREPPTLPTCSYPPHPPQ